MSAPQQKTSSTQRHQRQERRAIIERKYKPVIPADTSPRGILFGKFYIKKSTTLNELRVILLDGNYKMYYGAYDLGKDGDGKNNKLTVPELKEIDAINDALAVPRIFSSNVPCGYFPRVEICCCDRRMTEHNASFHGGRKYELELTDSGIDTSSSGGNVDGFYVKIHKYRTHRDCRRPMHLPKENMIPRCGLGRRRYFVKDKIIGKKLGILPQYLSDEHFRIMERSFEHARANKLNELPLNSELQHKLDPMMLTQIYAFDISFIEKPIAVKSKIDLIDDLNREVRRIFYRISVAPVVRGLNIEELF